MPHRLKIVSHRRRREGKTDYRQRLKLIKSGKFRLVVRKSSNGLICQIIDYKKNGDNTLISSSSNELAKFGWNINAGNLSAAYLTGLLCGKKAKEKDIKSAILDAGLYASVKASRIYAAIKGAIDAGLDIPHSDEVLPSENRASGKHIADYAAKLKKENPTDYKKLFSGYLKNNTQPESLPILFESVKSRILGK